MSGFAGFVNYDANFLLDIDAVTGRLWEMAGALGGGVWHGIDVVEQNGAFIQNSSVPLSGGDYCRKDGKRVCYLFKKGHMGWDEARRHLKCGAFFLPGTGALYLLRVKGGAPIYYKAVGDTLVFATSPQVLGVYDEESPYSELAEGFVAVYDATGLKIAPIASFPVVNLLS